MNDTSIVMIAWSPNAYRLKRTEQSLESMRAHTKRPHDLVVVDNGPEEQTKLIRRYEPNHHLINVVNQGVGVSRNQGAAVTDSAYIAFVDNDIGYFPGWLFSCIQALETYPEHKLVASVVKNKPMRLRKHRVGPLDDYYLYNRCAGMAMVMRRSDYNVVGPFHPRKTNVGHQWCASMKKHGYLFIHHPDWTGRHLCPRPSYRYKKDWFDPETGQWIPRRQLEQYLKTKESKA